MEKIACKIEDFLKEKLELYKELTTIMEMETACIIKMDVPSLWAAASRKKKIASTIEKQRNSILSFLDENRIDHTMSGGKFSISQLISVLPVNAKTRAGLEKIKIALDAEKNGLQHAAASNKRSIQEYLGVIDGVMSTIIGAVQIKSYGRKGFSGAAQSFYGTRFGKSSLITLISAQV